ncbi:hypothetical protein Tco_0568822 [Tanacetum coccineum]
MAYSSTQEQIPQQQDQPQDPGTPIPYDLAPPVDYEPILVHFEENNEVALIYLTILKKYFIVVSDFISKCPSSHARQVNIWLMAESYVPIHQGKKNGKMILESIENRPLVCPTIEENGALRPKKYTKLSEQEKLQDDYDVQAINIILQGLPPDVYSLVNHHKAAKDIWDRVNLLMKLNYHIKNVNVSCDDPIACLNKGMAYMSTVVASHFLQPTINSEHLPIQENKPPFKIAGLLFNKCKGDRVRVLLGEGHKASSVISKKHDVISVVDEEVTLILEEKSRSKMLAKQNDPISKEKELVIPHTPAKIEAPKELPKARLDIDNLETINIELEHSVANLLTENKHLHKEREHLKNTYKEHYDSIKKRRVQTKDHSDSLIAQLNQNCLKNVDLNAQIQEKVFAIAALKNKLRKLKEKNMLENAAPVPNPNVIAPRMFKLNLEPLAPKVLKNRDAHIDYIRHSMERIDTLREIVKNARALRPLDSNLHSSCQCVQRI